MARIELLVDDMDGTTERSRPVETHSFAIDGDWYEIDLHSDNAVEMQEHFARYVEHARPARTVASVNQSRKMVSVNHPAGKKRPPGVEKRSSKGRARVPAHIDKAQLDAERSWLRSHGHPVSNFGRVRADLHKLFVAAHLPTEPAPLFSAS